MGEEDAVVGFLRGLRIATLVIAAVIAVALSLPQMVGTLGDYRPAVVQIVAYVVMAVLIAVGGVLVAAGVTWGRSRFPVVAVLLVASVACRLSLPVGAELVGDWAYGQVGWIALIVLFDQPLVLLAAVVVANVLGNVAVLVLVTGTDVAGLLTFGLSSAAICALQLWVGVAGAALRRVAAAASAAATEEERERTGHAVAARLHAVRLQRYDELGAGVRPILSGLVDGTVDPGDPDVQRRCAIEAARMRRLFAESDDVDDPLLHELRACVEVAERRGVVVALATRGSWPLLPRDVRRVLTNAPLAALATAGCSARVSVIGTPVALSVGVITDGVTHLNAPEITVPGLEVLTTTNDTQLWVEARWTYLPS